MVKELNILIDYKIKTYEEAKKVISEIGLLPLAPLFPEYPALNTITSDDDWYTDTEFDPWMWRTKFSADGVAAYGKFIKKKSVLISRQLLPYVKRVLGSEETIEERYFNGYVSKEAYKLFEVISHEEGIDTRALRAKAGFKDKEQKKPFDQALVELQGSMDIVISGIKEKTNAEGEKKGWNSTSFETYDSWAKRNQIEMIDLDKQAAKECLIAHFLNVSNHEAVKKMKKIFSI